MKNNFAKIKSIILKTPLFIGVFIFFGACENDIQEIRELTARNDSAIISAEQVQIKYTVSGITKVLMTAPKLDRYIEEDNQSYIEFPNGVHMTFYDELGHATSDLKANYSIYYPDQGKWIARYDVEAVNENGEKLNTEYLVWLRKDEKITSDQFVKVTTEDGIIYGKDGFVSNQTFTSWEVINGMGVLNINANVSDD